MSQIFGNGGTVGSYCTSPNDFSTSLSAISSTLSTQGTTFKLSQPADPAKAIIVTVASVVVPATHWSYDQPSNSILFSSNIPALGSTVKVQYSIL